MKLLDIQAAIGTAILLLAALCDAKHSHSLQHLDYIHKRHSHHHKLHASPRAEETPAGLAKRSTCDFPANRGLVSVTPQHQNAGWAMSPNQPCAVGTWCPFACPPGQVMNQWNPSVTSYVYPGSMEGGVYCNHNGEIEYPFPEKDLCVDGTGTVAAENECNEEVAFCQTVLPGNEAMLIPTEVAAGATVTIAVPGTEYWCSTASHFYINSPGISVADACVWGDGSKPLGNWAPYVAGANTDAAGNTFAKIGWNPIYTDSSFVNTAPSFGIKFECEGCNGMPCSIDPSVDGIGGVTSSDQASGAGGANFCVVTIPPDVTATIVVFPVGESASDSSSSSSSSTSTRSPTSSAASKATSLSSSSTLDVASTPTSASISSATVSVSSGNSTGLLPTSVSHQSTYSTSTASSPAATSGSGETTSEPSATGDGSDKQSSEGNSISSSFLGLSILLVAAGMML